MISRFITASLGVAIVIMVIVSVAIPIFNDLSDNDDEITGGINNSPYRYSRYTSDTAAQLQVVEDGVVITVNERVYTIPIQGYISSKVKFVISDLGLGVYYSSDMLIREFNESSGRGASSLTITPEIDDDPFFNQFYYIVDPEGDYAGAIFGDYGADGVEATGPPISVTIGVEAFFYAYTAYNSQKFAGSIINGNLTSYNSLPANHTINVVMDYEQNSIFGTYLGLTSASTTSDYRDIYVEVIAPLEYGYQSGPDPVNSMIQLIPIIMIFGLIIALGISIYRTP